MYDNEIEHWYKPENFETSNDDKYDSMVDIIRERRDTSYHFNPLPLGRVIADRQESEGVRRINQQNKNEVVKRLDEAILPWRQLVELHDESKQHLFDADECRPGSFGEDLRKYVTVEELL